MSDDATAPDSPAAGDPESAPGHARADTTVANPRTGPADPALAKAYSERLYLAWWVWLLPLAAAALLAASVRRGYPVLPGWLPYAVLVPVAVFALVAMSRSAVRVLPRRDGAEQTEAEQTEAELRVGQARLPLHFIGTVEVIGKDAKRLALGPRLDPAAYIVHRASIGPLVRVELTDPDDDTPYWLFSTRKPKRLAEALGACPEPE